MRAFTDAATLSCHFIFLGIDRGKNTSSGEGKEVGERKEEREIEIRRRWENEPPEKEERGGSKVREVLISLLADWHIPTRGMVAAQIVPEQITISFAVTWAGLD